MAAVGTRNGFKESEKDGVCGGGNAERGTVAGVGDKLDIDTLVWFITVVEDGQLIPWAQTLGELKPNVFIPWQEVGVVLYRQT